MFVFRLTQTLLKDMKITPQENELDSPLLSWHANIIQLNRRKHILFVNDLSRLCLIIDGVRSSQINNLIDKFRTTLLDYLVSEEVEPRLIEAYMKDGAEVNISKTNNRSVLGTMKEILLYSTKTEFESKEAQAKWLNRIIYKPINYEEPIHVFKQAIARQYFVRIIKEGIDIT